MIRESRSRPRGSVPSGYVHVPPASHTGGIRRALTAWRNGSWGASHGARSAQAMARRTMPAPTARNRSRPNLPMGLAEADARVEVGDGHVGQEVHDDDQEREEDHRALDNGVVVGADRLHGQRRDAGPGEDGFGRSE